MNVYFQIAGILISVAGIIVACIIDKRRVLGLAIALVGLLGIVIPLFVFVKSVSIVTPLNDAVITPDQYRVKIAENKDKLIFTKIKIKGNNLPKKKYVHLLTCVANGHKYWVNGNPVPTDMISENGLTLDWVSFGKKKDGNSLYQILLLVCSRKIKSGSAIPLDRLPDYIVKSKTVNIRVIKNL